MKRGVILALVAAVVLGAGAWKWRSGQSQRSVLEKGSLTLFSLDPTQPMASRSPGSFHGCKILGQMLIHDPNLKAQLISALYEGIGKAPGASSDASGESTCHLPSHGLRGVKEGYVVDVTISFACSTVDFHDGGEIRTRDSWREAAISSTPRHLLDATLRAEGLPLAPRVPGAR